MILPDPLRLILAAFTVYRLAQFIAQDTGPFDAFKTLRTWLDDKRLVEVSHNGHERGLWATLHGLASCPYCAGFWYAVIVALLLIYPSAAGDFALLVFGLAGVQAFLQGVTP